MNVSDIISGRYEIIEEVGKGGMALVYKAKCLVLNRYVALKVLRPEFREDTDFINRFKAEAQSAGSLSHQNIVSIYDVGHDQELDYIVMEYVEGVTLKQYIAAKKVLPWREAVDYASQICQGLEHAHKKGIIHKDIKPQNIIITKEGVAKITDFGIAKVMSSSTIAAGNATGGNAALGSVHYFSPEQARGGFVDAKTDLYSLGVCLYEMVTGKLPFDGDVAVSVAMQHIEKAPVPPTELNSDIPKSLENVILKAMRKEMDNRYQSATEMLIDLKKVWIGADVQYSPENVVPAKRRDNTTPAGKETYNTADSEDEDEEDEGKKGPLPIIAGVLAGLALMAILFFFSFNYFNRGEEIELPDFQGMTIEEAQESSKDTNLEFVIDVYEKSTEFDEGQIISQIPKANKKVKSKSKVKLTISLGTDAQSLPSFVNMKSLDAEKSISALGLKCSIITEASDTVPKDYVIRQTPVNGTKLKSGDSVTLYVSTGKSEKLSIVPNLYGKTESDAKAELVNAGLSWGTIEKIESNRPEGTVISQTVPSGTEVSEKTVISFNLSAGEPKQNQNQQNTEQNQPQQNTQPQSKPAAPTKAPQAAPATQKPVIKPVAPGANY